MRWAKKGKIDLSDYRRTELVTDFVMLPTPILLANDVLRIFVGFCDDKNVGRIGYVDVNPNCPEEIIGVSDKPMLDIGQKGCFDDNGVVPLSVIRVGDAIYLYYVGFQLGVQVPYYMFGGLAISNDEGNTFQRVSKAPVLDRVNDEIYARCGMNVLRDNGIFKMWYVGSYKEGWTESNGKLRPLYTMKYIESPDGIHWHTTPIQCMKYANCDEHGFGRPYVWKENSLYRMLYSIRTYSRGYYIGYAESGDGITWERKDDLAGIDLSKEGWDSQNLSYPFVFSYDGQKYLFYNGNGCGRSGFGYAKLERDDG